MASEMKPPPEPQPNDLDWVCGGCGGGVDMMDEFDAYCSNCGEGDPSLRALWGHEWAAVAMMAAQQQLGVALVKEASPCPSDEAAVTRWREWLEYEFLSCEENEAAVFEMLGLLRGGAMKTARELAEELCSVRLNIIRREGDADAIAAKAPRARTSIGIADMLETVAELRAAAARLREREAEILAELDTLDRTSRGER